MRHCTTYSIHLRMRMGLQLDQAVQQALQDIGKGQGGVIAVDAAGHTVMDFNSSGMFRGRATSGGLREVGIWEETLPWTS